MLRRSEDIWCYFDFEELYTDILEGTDMKILRESRVWVSFLSSMEPKFACSAFK
jgi:hypothetical protein